MADTAPQRRQPQDETNPLQRHRASHAPLADEEPDSRRDGAVAIDPETRALLERWVRGATTPQRVVRRSRIVLLAADGSPCDEIAARLGISKPTVHLWIGRFERSGAQSLLHDAPGRGRHPSFDASTMRTRLEEAQLLDSDGHPVSLRRAAAFLQVSPTAVWRAMRKATGNAHPREPMRPPLSARLPLR